MKNWRSLFSGIEGEGKMINTKKFTVIENTIIMDSRLSVGAMGLYLAMQSFMQTSNKKFNKGAFFQSLPDNKIVLDEAWDEIMEKGYLKEYINSNGKKGYELYSESIAGSDSDYEIENDMESGLEKTKKNNKTFLTKYEEIDEEDKNNIYFFSLKAEYESALNDHKDDTELIDFLFCEILDILSETGKAKKYGKKIQITQSRVEDAYAVNERLYKIGPADIDDLLDHLPGNRKDNIERCKNLIRMSVFSAATDTKTVFCKNKIKHLKRTYFPCYTHRYEFDILSKYIKRE